jgi:hypothetical protein
MNTVKSTSQMIQEIKLKDAKEFRTKEIRDKIIEEDIK